MKTIEKQIINCLRNSDFLGGNYDYYAQKKGLSPRDSVTLQKTQKRVCLWGHCIFTLDKENNIKFSFQGWRTNTTKSRINALLSAFSSCSAVVYQRNYQLFVHTYAGEFPVGPDEIYTIKNGKPETVESVF